MISEAEALEAILAAVPAGAVETVPLREAGGRAVAWDLAAVIPLPAFDNSAMDGWAIHAADCGYTGVPLKIAGEQAAGAARAWQLQPGETVRIFTGAPLPAGAAAVVMQEDAERQGDTVVIRSAAAPGEFIRRAGSDICAGQWLVRKGMILTPQRIGVLASQGMAQVACAAFPRASVVCTGEELVAPGAPLPHAGCLYNSNGPMLAALLESARLARPVSLSTVPDDLEKTVASFAQALSESEVLIVAGGVSVGDHDLVKPALERLGIQPRFWRVSIKPGKPFLFGTSGTKLIFGLPGNPVSAFVTAVLFVLPALRRMAGIEPAQSPAVPARTLTPLHNRGDRTHYFRGVYDPAAGGFRAIGTQESHAIAGLSASNALARLEPGASAAAGEEVRVLLLPGAY